MNTSNVTATTAPLANLLAASMITYAGATQHPTTDCEMHQHRHMEIVYHRTGEGTVYLEDGTGIPFVPGSVDVYAPGVRHAQMMKTPGEDWCIYLGIPEALPPTLIDRALFLPSHGNEFERSLRDLIHHTEIPDRSDTLRALYCHSRATTLFLQLLLEHEQKALDSSHQVIPSVSRVLADRAETYLQTHFAHISTMEEVAESLMVSADHLRHVFAHEFGISLRQRLIAIRLERACSLLTSTPLPIKAIAHQCGFAHDRHLCAAFQNAYGCSPGTYRRQATYSL